MDSGFSLPACRVLLCGLIALGPVTAEAAGIGVHVRVHAQTMPRAVAGAHNPHVGAGAQAPSRLNPNTRSIQRDTAGESAAIKSPKMSDRREMFTSTAAPQGRR
jgi:hypothetical protein